MWAAEWMILQVLIILSYCKTSSKKENIAEQMQDLATPVNVPGASNSERHLSFDFSSAHENTAKRCTEEECNRERPIQKSDEHVLMHKTQDESVSSLFQAKTWPDFFQVHNENSPGLSPASEAGVSWSGVEEPVCRVAMGQTGGLNLKHLEVIGVLTSYESSFIEEVRQSVKVETGLSKFGACPDLEDFSALVSLRHIAAHLQDPRENKLIVMHLSEVTWGDDAKLQFKLVYHGDLNPYIETLQLSLLVFYLDQFEKPFIEKGEKIGAGGHGFQQNQTICITEATKYLIFTVGGIMGNISKGQFHFETSIKLWHYLNGSFFSETSAKQLLFGRDERCYTRMTPVIFLLTKRESMKQPLQTTTNGSPTLFHKNTRSPLNVNTEKKQEEHIAPDSHAASAVHRSTHELFLNHLRSFLSLVLEDSHDPPSNSVLHLQQEALTALPHQLLNISDPTIIQMLVSSESPLIFMFPRKSKSEWGQFLQWDLKGELLAMLTNRLQIVIEEVKEFPVFQNNETWLKLSQLLNYCYQSTNRHSPTVEHDSELPSSITKRRERKLHSFLLLKVLHTAKAFWIKKLKLSRENRNVNNEYCRLHQLYISLKYEGFILAPDRYLANNCQGPCTDLGAARNPRYTTHVILLIKMKNRGEELGRRPCCVPVQYTSSKMAHFTEGDIQIREIPNATVTECGCR
ncbi:muellerian-inhibiting factor [Protopterus annectens]|uniref:Muellerian-inhibiting factor n=1 Tax=Protopterus annectens TaxID=7888 RepID=A0A2U9NKL5_PROAN|nr:muellerian-inhibiting factor [Protopterus annectens]AWT24621.1 AMH [Protopterus annectens]